MNKKTKNTTLNKTITITNLSDLPTNHQKVLVATVQYLLMCRGRIAHTSYIMVKVDTLIKKLGDKNTISKSELNDILNDFSNTIWSNNNANKKMTEERVLEDLYFMYDSYFFSLTKTSIENVISLKKSSIPKDLREVLSPDDLTCLKNAYSKFDKKEISKPFLFKRSDIPTFLKLNALGLGILYSKIYLACIVSENLFTKEQYECAKMLSITFPIRHVMMFLDPIDDVAVVENTTYEYAPNKLNKAIKILNENTDKKITLSEIKDDDIVTHIQFFIHLSDEVPTLGIFL